MQPIVYFGTHEFSAFILESLITNGYQVLLVVTQPDRPVGRTQEVTTSPVKQIAQKYHLPTLQPETLKDFDLAQLPQADYFVVCQYGLIIPKRILDLPKLGPVNVHTSLLPKYRGASPIQSALINGETETGVTIMLMDEKMDHGPILHQRTVAIGPNDTYLELSKKMEPVAADALLFSLAGFSQGKIEPQIQDESMVTLCKIFTRDDGKIDWNKSADEIYNLYRGLTPWPGIWTTWNGKRLKLNHICPVVIPSQVEESLSPGTVTFIENKMVIRCGQSAIEALELQLEGKKAMDAKTFINGYKNIDEQILSS